MKGSPSLLWDSKLDQGPITLPYSSSSVFFSNNDASDSSALGGPCFKETPFTEIPLNKLAKGKQDFAFHKPLPRDPCKLQPLVATSESIWRAL